MRTSLRSRTLSVRLTALSAAVGAAALVGLGSTAASAAPPTSATASTTAASTTTASTTAGSTTTAGTTASTTTASTTTASTTAASTTTASTTATTPTPTPTTTGPRNAPGPQCPGLSSVLTPVVCIPTGSGEDQPAPVGTDGFLEFAAQVVNNGPAVSDATVVITLPKGLRLADGGDEAVYRLDQWWSDDSDDDGTPLQCTTSRDGSVTTCATGSVPTGANFLVLVDLEAQDDAVAGTHGSLSVALQSTPVAGTFPTTSVQAEVDFVGTAHLQVSITPTTANVTVGKSLTLVATVHNAGPDQAVEAFGIGFAFPPDGSDFHFLITNSEPLPGSDSGSKQASGSAFLLHGLAKKMSATRTSAIKTAAKTTAKTTAKSAAAEPASPIGYWPIGTIAPGATVSIQVVVKAESLGQAELDFEAASADGSCDDETDPDCENTATAELTAVAAVTTTATTAPASTTTPAVSTTSTPSASAVSATTSPVAAASLPNTGFTPAPWVGSAGAVILLGVGLMLLGAPRRRVSGGHHR